MSKSKCPKCKKNKKVYWDNDTFTWFCENCNYNFE